MSLDVTTLALAKSYTNQYGGSGGGSSVPKPLTFDYMPEGYPTKSVQTTMPMEEQQVAFTSGDYFYMAPITNAFEVVGGQTYTVNWDGTEYECVGAAFGEKAYVLGNLSILGGGADTGEPFIYIYNIEQAVGQFSTHDTAASHTISVKTTAETVTPMAFDYMPEGYPTKSVQTTMLMNEQVAFALMEEMGLYMAQLTNAFEIVGGQTYTVNWDGTEYECVGVVFNAIPALGNLSMMGAGDDTGEPFVYAYDIEQAVGMFATHDTSASHTISVKMTAEAITPMAEEYLPENIATKSDVESTQKVLDGVFSSVATFTFDKQTSGRDTFNFNAFNYYKISDFNPAPEDVISFKGTRESGGDYSEITTGKNCVRYGLFIVVASAGGCSLPISETNTDSFTAPSAGLYAQYEEGNQNMTAGTGEFTLRASTGSSYITGLLLKSSTTDSTKKFKITVDDSGTLKATEVT